jgi:hypothetical protein
MSTKEVTVPSDVPTLDGSNYHTWEQYMKSFLQTCGLFKLLRATYIHPPLLTAEDAIVMVAITTSAAEMSTLQAKQEAFKTWEDDNKKILGYINLKVTASIQQITSSHTYARTLWNLLATNYGTTRSAGLFIDFQSVTDWKFDDRKDPNNSINELLAHINRLKSKGVALPANVCAMILLKAVPRNWDNFTSMILATTPADGLTVQAIIPLITEEWK